MEAPFQSKDRAVASLLRPGSGPHLTPRHLRLNVAGRSVGDAVEPLLQGCQHLRVLHHLVGELLCTLKTRRNNHHTPTPRSQAPSPTPPLNLLTY